MNQPAHAQRGSPHPERAHVPALRARHLARTLTSPKFGLALTAALIASTVTLPAHAEVKIGFIGTLSGPAGALGQDQYDGFMLAVEQGDGKLGGVDVKVVKEDDQLKPEVAVQEAQRLIQQEKVPIITGVTFSNVMMAVHKPITDAGVFLVGSNAGPSPLAGKGCNPYLFITSWNNDQNDEAAGILADKLGYKRVYLMAPNYQAGKDHLKGFKRTFKGEIVDEVYTQVNQPDYSAEIANLQAAKPDAIYVFYPGGMGVNFVKQYKQAGLLGKLPMLSYSTIDGSTLPALKETALGAITAAPYAPDLDNPTNKSFVAAFEKKYNRVPSMYAAQSYDAANLIASALKKTGGKVDKDAFRSALKEADFSSTRGSFSFNTNQFPISDFYRVDVVKDKNGDVVLSDKATILSHAKDSYYEQCAMK